jgi:tellurite resistance protein TerC
VFGVTEEAYIVFAANAFALLGLRALYFLRLGVLSGSCTCRPPVADPGLHRRQARAALGPPADDRSSEIATGTSLAVIVGVLAITTVASLLKARGDPAARAHAGALREHPADDPPAR